VAVQGKENLANLRFGKGLCGYVTTCSKELMQCRQQFHFAPSTFYCVSDIWSAVRAGPKITEVAKKWMI
jgi:hypothetical protein